MKVETRRAAAGAVPVVIPEGRIAIGESSEAFARTLAAAIEAGARHVIIDASRLRYVDSSGIGEMISAARRLAGRGGKLGVAAPGPKIREILEITQLWRLFPIRDDAEELARELLAEP